MFDTTVSSRSGSRASHKGTRALALAALGAASIMLGSPRVAHAEEVSPDGKGIVGGALIGGEVVVFIEALAGVRSGTAYVLGAGGGAVAGGLGGYFVEQSVDDGRIPAYMLAGGLALIIPALVVTLDQTRFLPSSGAREDRPVQNLPPSDPGKPGGSAVIGAEPAPAPATPAPGATPAPAPTPAPTPTPAPGGAGTGGNPSVASRANGPQSLINMRGGSFKVGLPLPEVRPVFTASQKKILGVEGAGSELRFPVVGLTF
jgi:hypothetical protein